MSHRARYVILWFVCYIATDNQAACMHSICSRSAHPSLVSLVYAAARTVLHKIDHPCIQNNIKKLPAEILSYLQWLLESQIDPWGNTFIHYAIYEENRKKIEALHTTFSLDFSSTHKQLLFKKNSELLNPIMLLEIFDYQHLFQDVLPCKTNTNNYLSLIPAQYERRVVEKLKKYKYLFRSIAKGRTEILQNYPPFLKNGTHKPDYEHTLLRFSASCHKKALVQRFLEHDTYKPCESILSAIIRFDSCHLIHLLMKKNISALNIFEKAIHYGTYFNRLTCSMLTCLHYIEELLPCAHQKTFLHIAASNCLSLSVCKEILQKSNTIHAKDARGRTALVYAAMHDNVKFMRFLLSHGADPYMTDHEQNSPLHYSHLGTHLLLQRYPALINRKNLAGNTPLHEICVRSCLQDYTDKVITLLAFDAKVHTYNKKLSTPLHDTCTFHHQSDIAQLLLQAGAPINALNGTGQTPLHLALKHIHYATARLLIHEGASINRPDYKGNTPLHILSKNPHCPIQIIEYFMQLLLDRHEDITIKNSNGDTPLHLFIKKREYLLPLLPYILNCYKDSINIPDNNGNTPLHLAVFRSKSTINNYMTLFMRYDICINAQNNDGDTPLHLAIKTRNKTIERALRAAGAQSILNNDGKLPEHYRNQ